MPRNVWKRDSSRSLRAAMNAGPDQRDRQARCSGGPIDKARWSIELNAATRNWHVVEKAVGRPSCWLLTDVVLRTPRRSGGREPILGRSARRPRGRPAHAIPGGLFHQQTIAE